MTKLQKKIFECLFRGGHIVKLKPGQEKPQMTLFDVQVQEIEKARYSVRGKDFKLVARIGVKSTPFVFKHCRKIRKFKTEVYEINRQMILGMNGNCWMKKRYKELRGQQFPLCQPSKLQLITSTYKLSL